MNVEVGKSRTTHRELYKRKTIVSVPTKCLSASEDKVDTQKICRTTKMWACLHEKKTCSSRIGTLRRFSRARSHYRTAYTRQRAQCPHPTEQQWAGFLVHAHEYEHHFARCHRAQERFLITPVEFRGRTRTYSMSYSPECLKKMWNNPLKVWKDGKMSAHKYRTELNSQQTKHIIWK